MAQLVARTSKGVVGGVVPCRLSPVPARSVVHTAPAYCTTDGDCTGAAEGCALYRLYRTGWDGSGADAGDVWAAEQAEEEEEDSWARTHTGI